MASAKNPFDAQGAEPSPVDAHQLFKAGRLSEAIAALHGVLQHRPQDQRSRTFLFELLCFAGHFDLAERHLDLLVQEHKRESLLGTLLYKAVVSAEKDRQAMFSSRHFPMHYDATHTAPVTGTLNGNPFSVIADSDARIGEQLEIFVAGEYKWLPYSEISELHVQPPVRLRDLLWIPARVVPARGARHAELQEVMIPSMAPLSWQHPDEEVRLGRVSDWCEDESGEVAPYGLKTVLVDGHEMPVVEIRHLEIHSPSQAS